MIEYPYKFFLYWQYKILIFLIFNYNLDINPILIVLLRFNQELKIVKHVFN